MQYQWLIKQDSSDNLIETILKNRAVTESERDLFLNPNFEQHLHSPYLLKDLDIAIALILEYLNTKKKILVFGDYDADGVTATALFYSFLKEINAVCDFYIPHRIKDGYGITVEGVRVAKERGADLIITVDNGIVAVDAIEEANRLDIKVIITDHHKQGEKLPNAFAIINPNRLECSYPFKGISGVGVAFKVIQALSEKTMRPEAREKFLKWNLDLVALGTVADVMPLRDENRVLVHYGLKVITKSKRLGIKSILQFSAREGEKADTVTIGFQLGPRINAAGRLEAADKALQLLLTEDPAEADALALELNNVNKRRQEITEKACKEAEELIIRSEPAIIIYQENWHAGIIGLIAARLCEKYHKPVLVFTKDEEHQYLKASGRSPENIDITKVMMSAGPIIINGGGHRQACGCSIALKDFAAFKSAALVAVEKLLKSDDDLLKATLAIDTHLPNQQITLATLDIITSLAPYGQEFPEPIFYTNDLKIFQIKQVGFESKHLQISFDTNNTIVKAIGFKLGHLISRFKIGHSVKVAYCLSRNDFKGSSGIQLIVKDIKNTFED